MYLIVNKTPDSLEPGALAEKLKSAFACEVTAVLPHADEMMTLASSGIFAVRYPDHPLSLELRRIAQKIETSS